MTFRKTVLAYLTGWLIVQPIYNRVHNAWRKREMEKPSEETRFYWREQARAIVGELHDYTPGQDPPAALQVIIEMYDRVSVLTAERDQLEAQLVVRPAAQDPPSDVVRHAVALALTEACPFLLPTEIDEVVRVVLDRDDVADRLGPPLYESRSIVPTGAALVGEFPPEPGR